MLILPCCRGDIVKWVLRKTGPPAFLVKDADELSKAVAGKAVYLLGYFPELQVLSQPRTTWQL